MLCILAGKIEKWYLLVLGGNMSCLFLIFPNTLIVCDDGRSAETSHIVIVYTCYMMYLCHLKHAKYMYKLSACIKI